MLTIQEVRAEIQRYTYKPGWHLTTRTEPGGLQFAPFPHVDGKLYNLRLNIDFSAEDSRNPGRRIALHAERLIPAGIPEEGLLRRWLIDVLQDIEYHELREWLRYDGQLVDDPHAESRAAP